VSNARLHRDDILSLQEALLGIDASEMVKFKVAPSNVDFCRRHSTALRQCSRHHAAVTVSGTRR